MMTMTNYNDDNDVEADSSKQWEGTEDVETDTSGQDG